MNTQIERDGDYQCRICGREYNRVEDLAEGLSHPAICICESEAA